MSHSEWKVKRVKLSLRWIYCGVDIATWVIIDKVLSLALCFLSESPAPHY